MTTLYDDLFFRTNMWDVGQLPSPPDAYESPDIIPSGIYPTNNPQAYFSSNYNQDVGQSLVIDGPNYIYLRTKNLASGAQSGKVSLYYTPTSLLLYPNKWQNNALKTSDQQLQVFVQATQPGDIAVTDNPFVWEPSAISGDHYCLISRVSTPKHDNPIPQVGSYTDLTAFILNNPGFGWRNVSLTSANSPTFDTTVDYTQGTEAGSITFQLECTNVPGGASVAFSAGTPGPDPLIVLEKTTVPQNNGSWNTSVTCDVPANYQTNITYSYWANGTTPQPGFKLRLKALSYVDQSSQFFHLLRTPQQLGASPELARRMSAQRGIVLGSHVTIGR
ncbi:hypothetical protein D7Y13_04365 [Corallococcus praedator]|uniref:Uncharacterized protein n=1 Tax=Corallococcus praedator TaxID=2316724 RepID=A0ABX9QPA2_9BACT|nr:MULTISPECIES: hypothetical protein [Corallococcus]RKH21530.1 hypothetical protein D7X74_01165 [Corallococcus sp. CA047B]RKH35774.1 hypothetical protein D7X75_03205 [Corallococcus sp. CA031C]RKI15420.1 hypothetical protein D7Y13_04365 [Corallococcus praedator]